MSDIEQILTNRFKHIIEQENWNVNELFPKLQAGATETTKKGIDPISCCCGMLLAASVLGIVLIKCTSKNA